MWEGGGGVVMRGGVRCGTQCFIGQGGEDVEEEEEL